MDDAYGFKLPPGMRSKKEIIDLSNRYKYDRKIKYENREITEKELIEIAKGAKKEPSYLDEPKFLAICDWKSSRPGRKREKNRELIKEVTKIAFSKYCNEDLRILILTTLKGVGMRTASAILHLTFLAEPTNEGYPLMDFRTIRTLTGSEHKEDNYYTTDLWREYKTFCRAIAKQYDVDLRTLDRALWQYDEEKGKSAV